MSSQRSAISANMKLKGLVSPEEITAMHFQAERILRKGIAALIIKFPALDVEIKL